MRVFEEFLYVGFYVSFENYNLFFIFEIIIVEILLFSFRNYVRKGNKIFKLESILVSFFFFFVMNVFL